MGRLIPLSIIGFEKKPVEDVLEQINKEVKKNWAHNFTLENSYIDISGEGEKIEGGFNAPINVGVYDVSKVEVAHYPSAFETRLGKYLLIEGRDFKVEKYYGEGLVTTSESKEIDEMFPESSMAFIKDIAVALDFYHRELRYLKETNGLLYAIERAKRNIKTLTKILDGADNQEELNRLIEKDVLLRQGLIKSKLATAKAQGDKQTIKDYENMLKQIKESAKLEAGSKTLTNFVKSKKTLKKKSGVFTLAKKVSKKIFTRKKAKEAQRSVKEK